MKYLTLVFLLFLFCSPITIKVEHSFVTPKDSTFTVEKYVKEYKEGTITKEDLEFLIRGYIELQELKK